MRKTNKDKADYFNEQLPPDQSESSSNWTNENPAQVCVSSRREQDTVNIVNNFGSCSIVFLGENQSLKVLEILDMHDHIPIDSPDVQHFTWKRNLDAENSSRGCSIQNLR